jgi:transcriptional regulator with XRE-family HTH domain
MRLKEKRLAAGLTQEQVAKTLDIARNSYNQYETSMRALPYENCLCSQIYIISLRTAYRNIKNILTTK